MSWTFAGATFQWFREGKERVPGWNRPSRTTEREIFGTGETEFNNIGYGAYRISGTILIETTAHMLLLEDARGTSSTLSDGTRTCTAVLSKFELKTLVPGYANGNFEATVTFALPQPQDFATLPRI